MSRFFKIFTTIFVCVFLVLSCDLEKFLNIDEDEAYLSKIKVNNDLKKHTFDFSEEKGILTVEVLFYDNYGKQMSNEEAEFNHNLPFGSIIDQSINSIVFDLDSISDVGDYEIKAISKTDPALIKSIKFRVTTFRMEFYCTHFSLYDYEEEQHHVKEYTKAGNLIYDYHYADMVDTAEVFFTGANGICLYVDQSQYGDVIFQYPEISNVDFFEGKVNNLYIIPISFCGEQHIPVKVKLSGGIYRTIEVVVRSPDYAGLSNGGNIDLQTVDSDVSGKDVFITSPSVIHTANDEYISSRLSAVVYRLPFSNNVSDFSEIEKDENLYYDYEIENLDNGIKFNLPYSGIYRIKAILFAKNGSVKVENKDVSIPYVDMPSYSSYVNIEPINALPNEIVNASYSSLNTYSADMSYNKSAFYKISFTPNFLSNISRNNNGSDRLIVLHSPSIPTFISSNYEIDGTLIDYSSLENKNRLEYSQGVRKFSRSEIIGEFKSGVSYDSNHKITVFAQNVAGGYGNIYKDELNSDNSIIIDYNIYRYVHGNPIKINETENAFEIGINDSIFNNDYQKENLKVLLRVYSLFSSSDTLSEEKLISSKTFDYSQRGEVLSLAFKDKDDKKVIYYYQAIVYAPQSSLNGQMTSHLYADYIYPPEKNERSVIIQLSSYGRENIYHFAYNLTNVKNNDDKFAKVYYAFTNDNTQAPDDWELALSDDVESTVVFTPELGDENYSSLEVYYLWTKTVFEEDDEVISCYYKPIRYRAFVPDYCVVRVDDSIQDASDMRLIKVISPGDTYVQYKINDSIDYESEWTDMTRFDEEYSFLYIEEKANLSIRILPNIISDFNGCYYLETINVDIPLHDISTCKTILMQSHYNAYRYKAGVYIGEDYSDARMFSADIELVVSGFLLNSFITEKYKKWVFGKVQRNINAATMAECSIGFSAYGYKKNIVKSKLNVDTKWFAEPSFVIAP